MTSDPTLTDLAATRLQQLHDKPLPEHVEKQAILCLLDYLGALVSGLSAPWAPALLSYAQAHAIPLGSVQGTAHVISMERLVSAEIAAFTNAAIAHSIIRDDMHLASGSHIGVMIISAALALAERDKLIASQLLKGIVGGYEMAVALGIAVRSGKSVIQHFRPSGIIGAFGAAGAGLAAAAPAAVNGSTSPSNSVAVNALSLAANSAAGFNEWAWAGGMEITTQIGTASRSGITALDLARAGIESSSTILEGKDGVFAAYGCDVAHATRVFREWLTESELGAGILGAKFKPFAGCNLIQTPLAVAATLSAKIADAGKSCDNIERVTIVTTKMARDYPGCNNGGPFEKVQQTKMSLQYGVSAALMFKGRIDEEAYRQFTDGKLNALIQKCVVETDPGYDAAIQSEGRQPCLIIVKLKDGAEHREALDDVPWLGAMAVEERFKREAATLYDVNTVDRIAADCWELGSKEKHCAELFALLHNVKKTGR